MVMTKLLSLSAILALTACASLMHGTSQDIGISSSPTGATLSVDNQSTGQTPYIAHLSRKDNHVVELDLPGYAPAEMTLTRKTSGWAWGNIVFGGIIGLARRCDDWRALQPDTRAVVGDTRLAEGFDRSGEGRNFRGSCSSRRPRLDQGWPADSA
jgi:hypothetical protein